MTKPLKAYQVDHWEGPCEGSVIVFAVSNAPARREGASELGLDWDSVEGCRRAPQFDAYAPGPVPVDVLIESGWHFTCDRWECQQVIDRAHIDDDGEEVDTAGTYVVRARKVFCSPECIARHDASKRAKVAAEAALMELMDTRFPGCTVTRIHIYHDRLERSEPGEGIKTSACFTFPGAKYGGTYHFGDEGHAYVSAIDVPAFESLYRCKI